MCINSDILRKIHIRKHVDKKAILTMTSVIYISCCGASNENYSYENTKVCSKAYMYCTILLLLVYTDPFVKLGLLVQFLQGGGSWISVDFRFSRISGGRFFDKIQIPSDSESFAAITIIIFRTMSPGWAALWRTSDGSFLLLDMMSIIRWHQVATSEQTC